MNKFVAAANSCTGRNTDHRFTTSNHHHGTGQLRRGPVALALPRLLTWIPVVILLRASLCIGGATIPVAAHKIDKCIPTPRTSFSNRNNYKRRDFAASRSYRSLQQPSRFYEQCLRIQRGGANRFVNDDDNNYNDNNNNNNNNNDDETAVVRANSMQLDNENNSSNGLRKHSPVVYQYFGRSRSRGGQSHPSQAAADESPLNFILLGPNVDHWKTIGQILASRGFNVMACERMVEKQKQSRNSDGNDSDPSPGETNYDDAPDLVLEILDALKWDKAVLVGCDDESSLAVETAMMLAPDRVAGLILCGDLKAANQFAEKSGGVRVLDSFLHRVLNCPFVIVWDGGARSIVSGSSAHEAIETKSSPFDGDGVDGRCVILGGGSAPHRTKPEYFAWVLARFVEEKLEYHSMEYDAGAKQRSAMSSSSSSDPSMEENGGLNNLNARRNIGGILQNLNLPFGIDSLVSPEGRLLLGRAVAAAIFYTSVMKVIFFQYGNLRMGWISIKNSVDSVAALRRKIFQVTSAFVLSLPRLFKFSSKRTKELDDSQIQAADTLEKEDDEIGTTLDSPQTENFDIEDDDDDTHDSPMEDDDEDSEDGRRIKPLFFLDNIFT